jgi:putative copper export protein
MRRLHWIIAIALVVLIGGNILALIQQTMTFFGIGFVKALDSNFWSVVRIGSRFGDIWNIRMIFIGIVGMLFLGSIFLKDDQPESVRAFLTAGAWIMALIIGASSVLSHSAGSLLLPWLGIAVDWLHAVAVGFWAGGLIALVLILPTALKPYHGEARRLALLAVLRRYTRIATASVFIVIATGLYSATTWIFTPDDAQTTFGAALGLKLILVAGCITSPCIQIASPVSPDSPSKSKISPDRSVWKLCWRPSR